MKFICIRCDEYMKLMKADNSKGDSVSIIFSCSSCNNQIAMITNTQETNMVKTLGLNIGGNDISSKSPAEDITWTKEAEERFKRIPSFVKSMARQSIVSYARKKGVSEITLEIMDEVRERAGM